MIRTDRVRPTEQVYVNYTPEDFKVWKILYERQLNNLREHVSAEYLSALDVIGFTADKIPDFRDVNRKLAPITGWSLHVVPNISPQKEFFEFLDQKKFTATCWLRRMDELDYLEEPDMFHDVFGHAPLLANKSYTDFFRGISTIALKHIDNPKAIELLGRVYWFTIEFGLIREDGELKIYGAGTISSSGETAHAMSDVPQKIDFDVKKLLSSTFRTDIIQEKYFVIDSYEQLFNSLPEIEKVMEEMIEEKKVVG